MHANIRANEETGLFDISHKQNLCGNSEQGAEVLLIQSIGIIIDCYPDPSMQQIKSHQKLIYKVVFRYKSPWFGNETKSG